MKQPLHAVLLSALLFLPVFIFGQKGIWTRKADVGGLTRQSAVGFSIGGKGYITTGVNYDNNLHLKDLWEYDPVADTWSQKADFPGPGRISGSAFSIGDKGYVGLGRLVSGNTTFNDFYEYDPALDSWTQKQNFPGGGRYDAASFAAAGKGYISTGITTGTNNDLWEYDPVTDLWTKKTDFPGGSRHYASGFGIGDKGYMGTGLDADNIYKTDFYEYDAINDLWTKKADFGGGERLVPCSFAIGGKGYMGTGGAHGAIFSDFWEYEPLQDKWAKLADAPVLFEQGVGFSINGKGYIGSGYGLVKDQSSYTAVPNFYELDTSYKLLVDYPAGLAFCGGVAHSFEVNYTAVGNFEPGAVFTVQLLKRYNYLSGGTLDTVDVGTTTQPGTGTITVTLPADLVYNPYYCLRLAASPGLAGPKTQKDINIVYPNFSLSEDIKNATCNQPVGFIHLNPGQGDGKFQYLWNDGNTSQNRDGLPAGNYSVTVDDDGCGTITRSYTIIPQSPAPPAISFQKFTAPETIFQLNPVAGVASYGFVSFPNNTTDTTFLAYPQPSTNTTYSLHNLAPQTTYNVLSKSYCIGKTDSSDWLITPFQTPCGNADFTLPGDNKWNVYAYTGGYGDFDYSWLPADFAGYYVEDGLSFDSRTRWNAQFDSPSDAAGYQGCYVPNYNFAWRAIRKGFPCGHYSIPTPDHPEPAQLFVNGAKVWEDSYGENTSTKAWEGDLNGESIIEFRTTGGFAGGFGFSYAAISFELLSDLVPKPVITPAGPVVICAGSPVTLTSNSASGNKWYLNGSLISGAAATSYIATASGIYTVTATTDGCTSSPSEGTTVTVNQKPNVIATPSAQTICSGTASSIALASNLTGTAFSWTVVQTGVTGASAGSGASIAQTLTATGNAGGKAVYTITPSNGCTGNTITTTVIVNPSLSLNVNAGTISCNGGLTTITVNAGGGTGPYKYKLSGGASFQVLNVFIVGAGTYMITAQDAKGCIRTTGAIIITQPPAMSISLNATIINCYGGTATLNVTPGGGAPPYTYAIDNGSYKSSNVFNAGAGTHTISVKDSKGCIAVKSVTINQPSPVNVNISAGAILCNGATSVVTVNATGGTPPYTGTGTFTRNAGAYTFKVMDSRGCVGSKTVTLTQPAVLSVSLSGKTNVSCNGGNDGSITVRANGGTIPYSYKINNASSYQNSSTFSSLTAGTYSVTVKDKNGCSTLITGISISQPAIPLLLTLVQKVNVSCLNGANGYIKVSAAGGVPSYKYSLNNGSYGTSSTFSSLRSGTYTVNVKDANSCTKFITVVINNGTGRCNTFAVKDATISNAEINNGTWLKALVTPNPAETEFTLTLTGNSNKPVEIRVVDIYGRSIHEARGSANQSYKFGQQFTSGVYIVEILQGAYSKTMKIIKAK